MGRCRVGHLTLLQRAHSSLYGDGDDEDHVRGLDGHPEKESVEHKGHPGDNDGLVGNVVPGGALAHVDHYSKQQQFTQPGKKTALSAKRRRQRSVLVFVCYIGPPGVF